MKNNNYYKNKSIVSYDPDKTWIEKLNGNIIFCKYTFENEIIALKKMKNLLNNKSISIDKKIYKIKIPRIISWEKGILQLEYCSGKNLEFLLRDRKEHKHGVKIINELLKFCVDNKIYWSDFAPRNILIDKNSIFLVDFEKGVMPFNTEIKEFLRNHVYEEYCLFLLKSERNFMEEDLFIDSEEKKDIIHIKSIESERIRKIAKLLGHNKVMTKQQYLNILKLIIEVEEPYKRNKNLVFPGVKLDKIITNKNSANPLQDYAKEILILYEAKQKNGYHSRMYTNIKKIGD